MSAPALFVASLLEQIGKPLALDDLAQVVWELSPRPALRAVTPPETELRDMAPSAESEAVTRDGLRVLWDEIVSLSLRQRTALLLNLRDENGASAIEMFPLSGIASIDAIAEAVGMTAPELGAIWSQLPLDDLTIAARLGATRQQVINLRKCARERLARKVIRAESRSLKDRDR